MTVRTHAAFSLLEVTMAVAIFAVVLIAVLESMVNVGSYVGLSARQGDLELQSQRIHRYAADDLGNAAWMVVYNPTTRLFQREYPRVIKPTPGNEGFGDELVFLRLRTERREQPSSPTMRVATVDFAGDPAVPMAQYAKAKPITSLILNPDWVPGDPKIPFVSAVWEPAGPSLKFSEARDLAKLRHYRYIVKPDADVTGRGILFREYRNGDQGPWITDDRIADHIVSVTYFTNKEQSWLNPNQIRIAVDMQADDLQTGKARTTRHFEMTVAMRSTIDEQAE
jgi:hypothetical protein